MQLDKPDSRPPAKAHVTDIQSTVQGMCYYSVKVALKACFCNRADSGGHKKRRLETRCRCLFWGWLMNRPHHCPKSSFENKMCPSESQGS